MVVKKEEIVLNTDESAAKTHTMTGWLSRTGRFYKESDERLARWDGCTHLICGCGNVHKKDWTICEKCRQKKYNDRYISLTHEEWDGNTPLVIWQDDTYFFDEESVHEFAEESQCEVSDLQLIICEPNIAQKICYSLWADKLPEDKDLDDVAPDLCELIEKINDYIIKEKPILSWSGGKKRTSIKGRQ